METAVTRTWSTEQEAIFRWFAEGSGHLCVIARAGTGKTTTILEGILRAPEPTILLCAFNKRIAEELQRRLHESLIAEARTLHSLGYQVIQQQWGKVEVDGRQRLKQLATLLPPGTHFSINQLVGRIHTKARELEPLATSATDLLDLAMAHDLTPERWMENTGWSLMKCCTFAYRMMQAAKQPTPAIDYADMLYLPLVHQWTAPTYDLVVVDEAQDMTEPQLQLAIGLSKGRIVLVGDDRQAIYGFRGADSGSLGRLQRTLGAETLGLKTTYRCGQRIVEAAQKLVPDFACGVEHLGSITDCTEQEMLTLADPGDFILSRTNAPLIPLALSFLSQQRRCRVQGRDIGKNLSLLAQKIARAAKAETIDDFRDALDQWKHQAVDRATKADKEHLIVGIHDRAATLKALCTDINTVADLVQRLEFLFADEGDAQIILSTVHKAKGLESRRVFLLKATLDRFRDKGGEEDNIRYVAMTRAQEELVWVQ